MRRCRAPKAAPLPEVSIEILDAQAVPIVPARHAPSEPAPVTRRRRVSSARRWVILLAWMASVIDEWRASDQAGPASSSSSIFSPGAWEHVPMVAIHARRCSPSSCWSNSGFPGHRRRRLRDERLPLELEENPGARAVARPGHRRVARRPALQAVHDLWAGPMLVTASAGLGGVGLMISAAWVHVPPDALLFFASRRHAGHVLFPWTAGDGGADRDGAGDRAHDVLDHGRAAVLTSMRYSTLVIVPCGIYGSLSSPRAQPT